MPKNKRTSPTKHVQQKESRTSSSGKDKIFQSVQEMFGGQLEGEVVHMVLEECDWIVEKAVDILVNMCEPGIQTDQESKNKLAQIAFDVLCSDGSSDSMSVSSHSSMASSEETGSSRNGILAKPHTNNSRENILNSTEIEGASGFDPSMIEFENFESAVPNDFKNVNVMNQLCAEAEAWASSLDKGYKDFDFQSLPKHDANNITTELNSAKELSPQHPAKTFLISDLDFASKERSDIGMFDVVCTDDSSNTCGVGTSNSPNNTQKISTTNRGDTPTGIDACITSSHMEETSQESEIEQNFADICDSPSHSDDQVYISPEKLVYTGSENLGSLGNEELNMILVKHGNQDSAVPVSPVSVFENLGKLAGEIAHMEFQTQDDTQSSLEVFNSDDCVEGLLDRFKSDFQNSGLADVNFKTDVYKDDAELGCTASDKLENQHSLNIGGFTEPVLNPSKKKTDLQSCDSLSNVGNGTSDNKHVNSLNDVDNDQTKAEKALKESAICGFNIDNQEIDMEQNTDSISSEQLYESDVNTSGSSSDSLNESLTRALNDSITQTESLSAFVLSALNENDNEEVVQSLSCMSSHSEEEVGEELTTALNKSVDFTSPGEESDPESSQSSHVLNKAPHLTALPKLHDSDSEEKLNEFSEKIRMEVQEENQPIEGKNPQINPVILDSFKFALSVNACEFVPNVKQEVPVSSLFNVDTSSSNPNKPTFFTPKYISPPKSTRPMLPFDSKSQPPFSSGSQQQTSAWATPLRHHTEQPTGTYHHHAGHPPLKGPPQHPPPHWVSATHAPREGHTPKSASPTRMTDIQVVEAQIQAGHKCFVMLRGLPGSGKSTLARSLQHAGEKPGVILSSDDYFVQDGIYKFEPHLLSEAHEWNRLRTIQNLHNGCTPIIVDNTNTQAWEMKPYVKQAQKFGYDIYFLEPDTPWRFQPKELARRNTHGVPIKKIQMMLERYQKGLTVEQVLGKPAAQSSQHQNVHQSIPKDKPQSTNMTAHPGWRYPQNSLVQQYANSLGQDQKPQKPSVVTDTPKTHAAIEDNITEENFPQALSSVPTQPDPNPSTSPPCSNIKNNNNNISKEDWKMWEKLGLSDLVKQFSKGGHKNPEIVSSAAEITDIDRNRGVPMDVQYKETPVVVTHMEQENICPEAIPTTDQTEQEDKCPKEILPDQLKEQENENNKDADLTVGSPGKDDIQESAVSTAENTKNSRSPGSHKGSLSSHLRDVSPSSDSTFHTCCEMLTDQEEISSSTPEYHIAGSQDTSLDLSNTSSKEEGPGVIIESDSTADVDLDMRITDGTSDLLQGDSPDCHVIASQKSDNSREPDSHVGDSDSQKTFENVKGSQETSGDIQTVKFEDHVIQLTPAGDPSSQKISDDILHSKMVSEDSNPQNSVAVEDPETKLTSKDDVDFVDALADDPKSLSADVIETQETLVDIHRTQQTSDVPDNQQASADFLDPQQVSVEDLRTRRIPPDAAVIVVEDVVDEAVKCEAQSDSEQSIQASIETEPTQDSTLEESLLSSQEVAVEDSHQTVNDYQQDISNSDTNKSSIDDNKDSAVSIKQNVESSHDSTVPATHTCSIEDIPQGVKDTVDELIRDNVGAEINYSLDYTVTANELKAFLLFTDLNDDEKIMAEHYITHRLCGPKFTAQAPAQDDDNTAQQLPVIQEDLSKQTSGSSNTMKAVDWEEPKPARKHRHSKHSVVKHEESPSGSKSDIEKPENESCKTPLEPELEKVSSNTESSMNIENTDGWSHPQRQREKRTRNYRTHNSSSSMDDKDQGESTATSNVTPVACQALSKEEEASESSPSQSSLESSPTKPAKKKSNRRKLDPYKQGPFLEPEVKNRIIGADWSFPVLSELDSVVKDVIPKRKMQNSSEQETHISPRDLKVLNAVNRGEDPRHLIAGRTCYHILVSHNRDISEGRTETVIEKSVVDQHSVDCSTMTEENYEADLDFLQSSFPAIPMEELSEVLGQCGNNLQWAINLLLDWKYNIPLSSDDKDKFVTRMVQLQKSPTVPKFSFCAQPSSALRSPSSLLDMCVGFVESQHIAPRQDVENQIIMSSLHRLDSIEENIRLKRTHSRTYSQSAVADEELKENILKELTSTAESDGTSDASDDKGVLHSQPDVSYVESWTANQANDFARGPSMESSTSGHRSDEETYDFQNLQSSLPVMSMPISRDIIQALQSQFGPVPHLSGVAGDVMVPLDYRTAQALHRCLMLTAQQQNMERQRQLLEDEAYARRLQDEEILTTTSHPPPSLNPPVTLPQPFRVAPQTQQRHQPNGKGVTSLKDIINEEMDRQRKKEEEHKLLEASGYHDVLATRIKRHKLYEQFPGIDETLLDDIYQDNSYNLDNTVLAIRGFLIHNTEPPKNVRTAEASEAYEEKLIAAAKQQSLQEMMDNDMYSPEETKTFQEHEDPDYDDFRAEANIHYRLRHECFQKAQEAYRRGMREVASFYSKQGHSHTQKIKEANHRAADKILQSRNTLMKERSAVDLHGLHVDEAIEALERIIPEREEDLRVNPDKRKQHLVIITGRGNHSKGGIARIRPAVLRFLVSNGYKYSEIYKGCFKVLLKYR